MEELRTRIARTLRREREAANLSVSELARRAGISKATVSQLESGAGNPSVETLWALGVALGVPFAVLVDQQTNAPTLIRADDLAGVPSAAAAYSATLLSASPPGARRDVYLIQAEPGDARRSDPHHPGTIEHVVLIAGQALIGPIGEPVLLNPGDYLTYAGDALHIFEATAPGTSAVLISELR
ncbi:MULTISPECIES: helix-turn-helix domain-containing protein [unclassified Microbacterium]|uniref:helix-turn-helix domain-containing protein n=1 Tax=unclassified Microbacterium TaxID=2609290 RepID=UPI000CFABC96|nr:MULTISPECIES: XRE family transcriptional regulator [unclassified Microbacterium]PQZ56418.1 DNA-binding protein [Microbacterium sp. MYb43]PQZ79406.1 DNA-binding protein [Microbacterium sp. MYb40]PRB19974.1 DNA-binding protein [Microbacterium sp. MYb54]PRB26964.1 DNA-binding protein [Microbacterium sp. MYb50]PRB66090.1 DNA-binding protein [Microbacterium sp. MYb24]